MKRLIIVRHAKSSWDNPVLPDEKRPLNDRGNTAANKMANFLKSKIEGEFYLLSSHAERALQTAKIFHNILQITKPISIVKDFYTFSNDGSIFIEVVKKVETKADNILVFSHNETCYNLVSSLSSGEVKKFPTCALASFMFDFEDWNLLDRKKASLEFYKYPKDLE